MKLKSLGSGISFGWVVFIVSITGILLFQVLPGQYMLDDAFITFRYARNISQGLGYVYNIGEKIQGTTTPLYTLLLSFFAWIFGADHLPTIAFTISAISDVFNAWLFFRIARRLFLDQWVAFCSMLVFLLQPQRIDIGRSGMETSIFILFILAMYDAYFNGHNIYKIAAFGALVILTRADGVLAVAPLALVVLFEVKGKVIKPAVLATLILLPWFIWAWAYFGNPIPHSISAKHAIYQTENASAALLFIYTFLGTGTVGPYSLYWLPLPGLLIFIFLAVLGIKYFLKTNKTFFIMFSYPLIYFTIMVALNMPLFFSWYYPPLMPAIILLIFGGVMLALNHQTADVQRASGIAVVLVMTVFSTILINKLPGLGGLRTSEQFYDRAAAVIGDQVKRGQLVFAPDVGVIGWKLADANIYDQVGLVSDKSMDYPGDHAWGRLSSPKMILDYQPEFIISRRYFIEEVMNDQAFLEAYQLAWSYELSEPTGNPVFIYKHR